MKKFQVLAHRGLVSEFVPENTIKAFADAIHSGADIIETDIQCSSDGVPIVFHDKDFFRMSGIRKKVSDLSWTEISLIDIGFGKRVPSLEQALLDFPNVKFNLDIKSDNAATPTAAVINKLNAASRILISSFKDSRRSKTVALVAGPIRTSAGSLRVLALWATALIGVTPLFRRFSKSINALQIPPKRFFLNLDSSRFISQAKSAGLELHYWTINDLSEIRRLRDLGADGVVTDYCDEVAKALKQDL